MLRTTAIAKELATIERKMQETENATLKEALKKKQARLKAELKDPGQSTAKLAKTLLAQREVVKQLSKVEFNDLIRRLSKKPEYSFLKTMPKSTVKNDLEVTAKPVGWRFKGRGNYDKPTKAEIIKGKKNGTVYREVRPRRSDVSQVVRLAEGGGVDSIEPTGYKQNDAVEYGKKLIDAGVKYSAVRNKIEEHYAGLRGEIQDVMNKVLDYKESKMKDGGGVFMRGGVMGDIYSIEDTEQFKQVITVYNELSEKFGVVNYFLDHNDNSVVFLMEDAEYNKTMDLDRYVNSLHERGFDVLDKTQDLAIKKDNGKNAKYYFKLNLSKKVVYAKGGSMYAEGGSLEQESVEMINNQATSAKHHIDELKEVLSHQKHIEPWVIAKMQRATTDLSDITHYLDGKDPKMAFGGVVYDLSNDAIDRMEGLAPISSMMVFNNNVLEISKSFEEEGFEKDEISSYLSYKIVEHLNKMMHGGIIEVGDKVKASKEYGGKSGTVIEKRGSFVVVEDSKGKTESYHESDLIKKMAKGGGVDEFPEVVLEIYANNTCYYKTNFTENALIDVKNQKIKFTQLDTGSGNFRIAWKKVYENSNGYYIDYDYFGGRIFIENWYSLCQENKPERNMAKGGCMYADGGSIEVGDSVSYTRKLTGVKTKGSVIEIDEDEKYVKVRNSVGNIDYIPASEIKKMSNGSAMYAKGGEVSFTDYKGESIMFEPHFKEYYVGDAGPFNTLDEAKEYIDGGSQTPDSIKDAYRKGLFARGGQLTTAQQKKFDKVMHEWGQGKLHSGSEDGPIVKDQDQAIAIAYAEARGMKKMAEGGGVDSLKKGDSVIWYIRERGKGTVKCKGIYLKDAPDVENSKGWVYVENKDGKTQIHKSWIIEINKMAKGGMADCGWKHKSK